MDTFVLALSPSFSFFLSFFPSLSLSFSLSLCLSLASLPTIFCDQVQKAHSYFLVISDCALFVSLQDQKRVCCYNHSENRSESGRRSAHLSCCAWNTPSRRTTTWWDRSARTWRPTSTSPRLRYKSVLWFVDLLVYYCSRTWVMRTQASSVNRSSCVQVLWPGIKFESSTLEALGDISLFLHNLSHFMHWIYHQTFKVTSCWVVSFVDTWQIVKKKRENVMHIWSVNSKDNFLGWKKVKPQKLTKQASWIWTMFVGFFLCTGLLPQNAMWRASIFNTDDEYAKHYLTPYTSHSTPR